MLRSRLCLTESYSDTLFIQALAAPAPAAPAPAAGSGVAVEVMVNCSAVNLLETPVPMDGWCALCSRPQLGHSEFAAHAWKPRLRTSLVQTPHAFWLVLKHVPA